MSDTSFLQMISEFRAALPRLAISEASRVKLAQYIADMERGTIRPERLLQELAGDVTARAWLREYLGHNWSPLSFAVTTADFQILPGKIGAIDANEFICPEAPECSSRWFRQRVGQEPPICQKHGVRLIPKPRAE